MDGGQWTVIRVTCHVLIYVYRKKRWLVVCSGQNHQATSSAAGMMTGETGGPSPWYTAAGTP